MSEINSQTNNEFTTPAVSATAAVVNGNANNTGNTTNVTSTQQQIRQQREYLYRTLARQLEYYFSTNNLSRDTYVQTLRDLNDGCVPVTILVGFGKVRTVTAALTTIGHKDDDDDDDNDEKDDSTNNENKDLTALAMEIVRVAATKYSDLLHVVRIDTETGKRVAVVDTESSNKNNEDDDTNVEVLGAEKKKNGNATDEQQPQQQHRPWRWAIGSLSGQPIPMDKIEQSTRPSTATDVITGVATAAVVTPAAAVRSVHSAASFGNGTTTATASTTASVAVANTIILRDVPKEDSKEDTIRGLFKDILSGMEDCPQIVSAHLDVHDCW
jgi:La domain